MLARGCQQLVQSLERLVQIARDVKHDEAVALVRLGEDGELLVHVQHEESEGVETPVRELVAELPALTASAGPPPRREPSRR